MVAYQEWTQIAFNVAKARGFDPARPGRQRTLAGGRSFSKDNPNAQAVAVFAEIWNERKDEIKSASRSEAREIAQDEVTIS